MMIFLILLVLPHYSLKLFCKIGLCPHQLFGYLDIRCVYQKKIRINAFSLFTDFQNNGLASSKVSNEAFWGVLFYEVSL